MASKVWDHCFQLATFSQRIGALHWGRAGPFLAPPAHPGLALPSLTKPLVTPSPLAHPTYILPPPAQTAHLEAAPLHTLLGAVLLWPEQEDKLSTPQADKGAKQEALGPCSEHHLTAALPPPGSSRVPSSTLSPLLLGFCPFPVPAYVGTATCAFSLNPSFCPHRAPGNPNAPYPPYCCQRTSSVWFQCL